MSHIYTQSAQNLAVMNDVLLSHRASSIDGIASGSALFVADGQMGTIEHLFVKMNDEFIGPATRQSPTEMISSSQAHAVPVLVSPFR